jgi:hypothetical protein
MEHISNLINTASLSVKREESKYDNNLDPHITDVVNKLFAFFYSICRGFEKQYQDPKRLNLEKTQWIKAFMDTGINTLEKIQLGVKRCRLESPINTPTIGQFIQWCTPEPQDVGLPTLEKAYAISILMNRQFSDYIPTCQKTFTVIRHVLNQIGPIEFRSMSADRAFKTFERYYPIACREFMEGRLVEIRFGIKEKPSPHPIDRFRSDAARKMAMDAIRKMGIKIKVKNE